MQAPIAVNGTEIVDLSLRNSLREEIKDDIDIEINLDSYLSILERLGRIPTYINSCDRDSYDDSTVTLECKAKYKYTYPVGGHMVKHTDTLKGDNHIGTLVIVKKEAEEGGELKMTDYDDGVSIHINGNYSDNTYVIPIGVEHEVTPVIKGTRVSLVYDIFTSNDTTSIEATPPVISLSSGDVSITVNRDKPWDISLVNKYTAGSKYVAYPDNPDIVESLILKMITETYEVIKYHKGIVVQNEDEYVYNHRCCGVVGKLENDIHSASQYNDQETTYINYYLANIMELKK